MKVSAQCLKRIKQELETIIRKGLPVEDIYERPLQSGVFALKAFLIREGLLEGTEYSQLKEMAQDK